jgi:pimeloyl-ACP methyl ester carboxylesterase
MSKIVVACLILVLARTAAATSSESPAFDREEIRFASGRFELVGDLLTPPSGEPHPAVVYVWGAGPTNRHAHIENSPILKAFLSRGFAVLLYDKPGSGQSTGALDNRHIFAELASILIDAIELLKQHRVIDSDAIGLYGSSQASYVMATALARTRDVAFVIAWSCPMENSIEQSAYLVRNYVLCDGGSLEQANAAERAYVQRGCARTYSEYRTAAEVLDGIPAIRDGLGWAGIETEGEFTPADPTSESFLDPSATVASLEIPILALFAENDRQVDAIQGADAYRRLLRDGGHALSMVTVVPGADHNMNLSPRGCMQDQKDGYKSVGGKTLSPVFQETVTGWLGRLKTRLAQSPPRQ